MLGTTAAPDHGSHACIDEAHWVRWVRTLLAQPSDEAAVERLVATELAAVLGAAEANRLAPALVRSALMRGES